MKTIYRDPQVEEGISNIVLQNRCGNRLTLLFHQGRTDLEFVYKPNAFRRKEFRARNFSNRDNFTQLFPAFSFPEIGVEAMRDFGYDPFVTTLDVSTQGRAKNTITILNVPDENCFAIAARSPLTLAFRPHRGFTFNDGLITERFADRGEEIISFVKFPSYELNRFRVLDDGRVVLQIMEDDLVFVGGEETPYQASRVANKLDDVDLPALKAYIEAQIEPVLGKSAVSCRDPKLQKTLDLNKRIVYSGLDEGGACFGALNRIYYLIWVRDGAMAASMFARAGLPDFLKIWTPFLLGNPSIRKVKPGPAHTEQLAAEYLQMVGTRWTKSEDDGIFYALLSLYTLYQTTGDPSLLHATHLTPLLEALDYTINARFDPQRGLFVSDTRGETTLTGSAHFGYDSVNGQMALEPAEHYQSGNRDIRQSASLYHNINLYNAMCMAEILLYAAGYPQRALSYRQRAAELQATLQTKFVNDKGNYYAGLVVFEDGSEKWETFAEGDAWEYAWAVSVGPFFPDIATAQSSARMAKRTWSQRAQPYGYCPWNTLGAAIKEFGLDSENYAEMLADELREAWMPTVKYQMRGALTEQQKHPEGWRALPFCAGSLHALAAATLLQALPQGLAVRAGKIATWISNFQYRTARIDVVANGSGDVVAEWTLNGQPMTSTLQIPEQLLRAGANSVSITCAHRYEKVRLHGSNARLLKVEVGEQDLIYHCSSAIPAELYFEGLADAQHVEVTDRAGKAIPFELGPIAGLSLSRLAVTADGDFVVRVKQT